MSVEYVGAGQEDTGEFLDFMGAIGEGYKTEVLKFFALCKQKDEAEFDKKVRAVC